MAAPGADQLNQPEARQQRLEPRLRAIVDIFGIWESEALEATAAAATASATTQNNNDARATSVLLPMAEKVARSRAEASVKALVDSAAGDAADIAESVVGTGAREGTGTIEALMREWWPRLISAAVDGRDWEFVCR